GTKSSGQSAGGQCHRPKSTSSPRSRRCAGSAAKRLAANRVRRRSNEGNGAWTVRERRGWFGPACFEREQPGDADLLARLHHRRSISRQCKDAGISDHYTFRTKL